MPISYPGEVPVIPPEKLVLKIMMFTDEEAYLWMRILYQDELLRKTSMVYKDNTTGYVIRVSDHPQLDGSSLYLQGANRMRDKCLSNMSSRDIQSVKDKFLETLYNFTQTFRKDKQPFGCIFGNDDIYEF